MIAVSPLIICRQKRPDHWTYRGEDQQDHDGWQYLDPNVRLVVGCRDTEQVQCL